MSSLLQTALFPFDVQSCALCFALNGYDPDDFVFTAGVASEDTVATVRNSRTGVYRPRLSMRISAERTLIFQSKYEMNDNSCRTCRNGK